MADFPYNPVTAFLLADQGNDIVYTLQPASDAPTTFELVSLNVSNTVDTANISTTATVQSLPFSGDSGASYTSLIDSDGTISIYTGDCRDVSGRTNLWSYTPIKGEVNGTWTNKQVTEGPDGLGDNRSSNFLAAGMVFSALVNSSSNIYIFGGMCPNTTSSSAVDWQSSANYSDTILLIEPQPSSSTTAEVNVLSSRGPPIPEAGLTITPLKPTFFNSTNGNTSQQQNFVLIGGHTQEAFINMSQVALFSLPEQSWAFLPVSAPTTTAKTDLAVRDGNPVDPRSGHTAILTADGQHIVVFGGWVGDVTTPATPQLAILELGEGFGGSGDWQWIVPEVQGTGPADGGGIYGHGAVLLPGEVMMVVGGRLTSASGITNRRTADSQLNTSYYFFNITSGSWTTTYSNPLSGAYKEGSSESESSARGLSSTEKVSLSVGLILGLATICGAIALLYLCTRRSRKRREARERELRDLALGVHNYRSSGGIDRRGDEKFAGGISNEHHRAARDAYPWTPHLSIGGGPEENTGWREMRGADAERTGLLVEIPSPTRGLRRSLHSRSSYQQPTWYEDGRRSRGSGNIHPIDERGEYDEDAIEPAPLMDQETRGPPNFNLLASAPVLDPFRDPVPLGSHPVRVARPSSPQSPARQREREIQNWVSDWTVADALMQQQAGRVSPDKTDRTSSTLSEQSTYSNVSAHSIQRSISTIGRSISQRSTALFSSQPLSSNYRTTATSHNPDQPGDEGPARGIQSLNRRSQSLTLNTTRPQGNISDSVTRNRTSFPRLQSEGEALLGGFRQQGESSQAQTPSRARGWMGSMRRALTGTDRSGSTSPESGERSVSSSPTKYHYSEAGIPRRAASAGAMLWRARQGARDWDIEDRYSNGRGPAAAGQPDRDEGEWDVESAVERRVVQVMFTVPKEKLRVVNGAPDGDDESFVSAEQGPSGMHAEQQDRSTMQDEAIDSGLTRDVG